MSEGTAAHAEGPFSCIHLRGPEVPPSRKNPGLSAFRFPLVLLLLTFPLWGCVWQGEAGEDPPVSPSLLPPAGIPGSEPGMETPPTALVEPLEPGRSRRQFLIDTHLVVDQDVTIKARRSGIVEEIPARRGDRVHQGDLLLRLENRDLTLFLRRAEILRDQRRAEFQRARRLEKDGTISRSEFEEKKMEFQRAQVDVEIAREELERSLVRAPFDGLIMERFAKVGQKIIEDENVPLFRLTKLSPLEARLYLTEEVARRLQVGDEVVVTPRYLPDVAPVGRVEWISPVIDTSSGTSLAIVSVPGGGEHSPLRPGTAVTVELNLPVEAGAVLVPRSALEERSDLSPGQSGRVEVLKDGIRSWRRVRLGEIRGDRVEVLEGLRPGEKVVLKSGPAGGPARTTREPEEEP